MFDFLLSVDDDNVKREESQSYQPIYSVLKIKCNEFTCWRLLKIEKQTWDWQNTQIQSFTIVGRLSIVVYIWCEGVVNFRAHILKIMRGSFSHCNNFRQISSCKVNRIKEKGKQCKLVVMRHQNEGLWMPIQLLSNPIFLSLSFYRSL